MKLLATTLKLVLIFMLIACVSEAKNKKHCEENQILVKGSCVLIEPPVIIITPTPAPTPTIQPKLSCGSVPHNGTESRIAYNASSVAYGQSCSSIQQTQTRTCNDGVWSAWSGTYQNLICTVQAASSCGNIPHNGTESRIAYSINSVPYGQSCSTYQQTQTRTCNNGVMSAWTGTYTNLTCSVQTASSCGNIAHGAYELRTMYQVAAVNEGNTCVSQIQNRLCTNGQFGSWSGTYTQASCVISRVRYEQATVALAGGCHPETQRMTCAAGVCGVWNPNNYIYATCILQPSNPITYKEIFVATNGSDSSGTGSFSQPYATLGKALQVAVAHDIITLRAGSYRGTVDGGGTGCSAPGVQSARIRTPYLTIQGYAGESVAIDNRPWDQCRQFGLWVEFPAHHFTVKNLEIAGGTYYAIKFDAYVTKNTNDPNYGATAHDGTIDTCNIHDSGYDLIKIVSGVHNITIKNSQIHDSCWNLSNGGTGTNCQGIDAVNSHNGLVQSNHVYNIADKNPSVYFKGGSQNTIFEKNLIENGYVGIALGGNTGSDFMNFTENPLGYQTINAVVRNNIIKDMTGAGIEVYCASGPKIYNNSLLNVATTSTGPQAGQYYGVAFKLDGDTSAPLPSSTDVTFVNNIVYRNSGATTYKHRIFYNRGAMFSDGYTYSNAITNGQLKAKTNIYFDPNLADFYGVDVKNGRVDEYSTFSQWKASALHASGYAEVGSLYVNPTVDLITGAPLANSPAIHAGIPIEGLIDDYYGNQRGNLIDIGAVQSMP